MESENKCTDEKKITVKFSSTDEMSAKSALKMLLDTYTEIPEEEYREAQ